MMAGRTLGHDVRGAASSFASRLPVHPLAPVTRTLAMSPSCTQVFGPIPGKTRLACGLIRRLDIRHESFPERLPPWTRECRADRTSRQHAACHVQRCRRYEQGNLVIQHLCVHAQLRRQYGLSRFQIRKDLHRRVTSVGPWRHKNVCLRQVIAQFIYGPGTQEVRSIGNVCTFGRSPRSAEFARQSPR